MSQQSHSWRRAVLAAVLAASALSCTGSAPATAQTPEAAYTQAVALQRSGQHLASVPYFEAVARMVPEEPEVQLALGMAYYNASIQTTLGSAAVRYVVATSQQRAQLRGLALTSIRRAERIARSPEEEVRALEVEARVLELLGYVAESRDRVARGLSSVPEDPTLKASRERLDAALSPRHSSGTTMSSSTRPAWSSPDPRSPVRSYRAETHVVHY